MIARGNTRQTVLVAGGFLYHLDGLVHHGVYLRVVLLHVALTQFEERTLGLLHQVVDIYRLVEGHALYAAGERDELAGQRLLCNDAGMILDVSRRCHTTRQFGHVAGAADVFQVALARQLLGNRPYIHRLFLHRQLLNGLVNLLVTRFVETIGIEHLAHHGVGILVYHQGAQHGLLYLASLRLYVCISGIDSLLAMPPLS